jgi:hypothetical protein
VSYTNGEHRPYSYSDQYKSGGHGSSKPDAPHPHHQPHHHQQHGQPPQQGYAGGQGLTHYSWNTS